MTANAAMTSPGEVASTLRLLGYLALSVVLMGLAASFIARLLGRFRWIAWIGLAIILYVAVKMLYEGADQLLGHTLPMIPFIKGAPPVPH